MLAIRARAAVPGHALGGHRVPKQLGERLSALRVDGIPCRDIPPGPRYHPVVSELHLWIYYYRLYKHPSGAPSSDM